MDTLTDLTEDTVVEAGEPWFRAAAAHLPGERPRERSGRRRSSATRSYVAPEATREPEPVIDDEPVWEDLATVLARLDDAP